MEVLDGKKRQSGIQYFTNRETTDRINTDQSYSTATMAATAVVSPTSSIYSNGPPPPYTTNWPAPAHTISGLISPPESRRTSDNKNEPPKSQMASGPPQQQRQSLPSIHEALNSNASRQTPYRSPTSSTFPPQPSFSQPSAPSIPRSHPPTDNTPYQQQHSQSQPKQHSPPQPVYPQASSFSRSETGSFPDTPRHPAISTLQPPPPNPYAVPSRHELPSRFDQDLRPSERGANGYTHPPTSQQSGSYTYGPPAHQLAGQPGPTYSQPRHQNGEGRSDFWKTHTENTESVFKQGLKRHLDVFDVQNSLAQVNSSSHTLHEWSCYYNAIAQEQQRTVNAVPDRMPNVQSCDDMIAQAKCIVTSLERMRAMIFDNELVVHNQMREQIGKAGPYDEEMSNYSDDIKHQSFGSESKKRRGRAAPPGRCHSCNRAETPEWRRGPDGARTLCNACGLHYAKVTRKNTLKQSRGGNGGSIRPKSEDEGDSRPPIQ